MPYELFMALRYLRSRQRRRLVRVTALIAVVGIAVGVAALIVALALADGFQREMRDKILHGTAHLTVIRSDGQGMSDHEDVAARIRRIDGVVSANGTTYDGAVLVGPKGSAYAILRGISLAETDPTANLPQTIVAGSADQLFVSAGSDYRDSALPFVVLGVELAARTGLQVGDTAEVIPASSAFGAVNSNRRRVLVAGIFRSGLFEYDSTWIYLPLDAATAFSGDAHAASVISVQVQNIYDVKQTAATIRQLLGSSYKTIDWQEANRPLFAALELERRIGAVIIGLIILIAALNITTSLILVVIERRRDIAVLNTLGAGSRSIMSVFIIEGAIVGLVGAGAGVVLGICAIVIANRFKLISLPAEVYSISHVPLSFSVRDALFAALVAVVLSIIATLYPARAAANMRPAETLSDAG